MFIDFQAVQTDLSVYICDKWS